MTSAPSAIGQSSGIARHDTEPTTRVGGMSPAPVGYRAQNAVIVVLLCLYAVLGWRARFPTLDVLPTYDEIVYWSLSESIASGSYREIYQVSAPRHVMYPPAYPAFLAVVRPLIGNRIELVPVVNLTLVCGSLLTLTLIARRLMGGWLAVGLLGTLALNPSLLSMGGSARSEALFFALSIFSLVAARAAKTGSDWRVHAAIALALLAFLTRVVGLTLVVAIGVWLLQRRQRRELLIYALSAGVVVGGWFAYTRLEPPPANVNTYAKDFSASTPAERSTEVVGVLKRAWNNSQVYAKRTMPNELALPAIPKSPIDNVFWLAVGALAFALAIPYLWREWRALLVHVSMYGGVLAVWAWPVPRFVWPVVPLVTFIVLLGLSFATRMPARVRAAALSFVVVLLLVGGIETTHDRLALWSACDRDRPKQSEGCFTVDRQALIAAGDYVKQFAPANAGVLAEAAPPVSFVSGHRTESAAIIGRLPRDGFAAALDARGIRHVVLTARTPIERGALLERLRAACTDFQVHAHFPEHTMVLSVTDRAGSTANACSALEEYRAATRANGRTR